ncbi:MAG: hypothetical protein ACK48X_19435, partial [Planctomycetota bacterium]
PDGASASTAAPVAFAGLVQGSWYRQQMSAGRPVSAERQVPQASEQSLAPADSFRPGSIRSANPEIILRRPRWSRDESK